jgi:hypothetical protein
VTALFPTSFPELKTWAKYRLLLGLSINCYNRKQCAVPNVLNTFVKCSGFAFTTSKNAFLSTCPLYMVVVLIVGPVGDQENNCLAATLKGNEQLLRDMPHTGEEFGKTTGS